MNEQNFDLLNGWHHTAKEERLRVVMLYEDLAMGRQAKGLFGKVEDEFEDAKGFDYHLWRVDALRAPDFFVITVSEAANADMVVVAVHAPALSSDLWKWLDVWVGEAREDTALVVLFDRRYGWQHAVNVKRQLEELIGSRRITIFVESVETGELSPRATDAREVGRGNELVAIGELLPQATDAREEGALEKILPLAQVYAGTTNDAPKTFSTSSWSRWGINE